MKWMVLVLLLLLTFSVQAQIGSGFKGRGGSGVASTGVTTIADTTTAATAGSLYSYAGLIWYGDANNHYKLLGAWRTIGTAAHWDAAMPDTAVFEAVRTIVLTSIRDTVHTQFSQEVKLADSDADSLISNPAGFSATNSAVAGTLVDQYKDGTTQFWQRDSLGNWKIQGDVLVSKEVNFANTDSSAKLFVNSSGHGELNVRAANGDLFRFYDTGSYSYINAENNGLLVYAKGAIAFSFDDPSWIYKSLNPNTNDSRDFGESDYRFRNLWLTDNFYLGGKSQTAQMVVGQMKTMTQTTDSCAVLGLTSGEARLKLMSSGGLQVRYLGAFVDSASVPSAAEGDWVYLTTPHKAYVRNNYGWKALW